MPFTAQRLTFVPLTVVVVTVAEVMILPAPPISVRSTAASCEQSTTGLTTARLAALTAVGLGATVLLAVTLPPPLQPAIRAALRHTTDKAGMADPRR